MSDAPETTDDTVLDLLRRAEGMRISQFAAALNVTATAVRQRLTRLMARGLVERSVEKAGRGRPGHLYSLTEKGRRQTGSNFADLAVALWQEVRQIQDAEVRRGLLGRLSRRLASVYAAGIEGSSVREKMASLVRLFGERDIPFDLEQSEDGLPVLKAMACPYTELAEQDRTVCAMERMLFSEIVGTGLRLSECRLDGRPCCTFELN